MVGNLAQANVMVKADAKMAFASVTHSSVVTIAHKVSYNAHVCTVLYLVAFFRVSKQLVAERVPEIRFSCIRNQLKNGFKGKLNKAFLLFL